MHDDSVANAGRPGPGAVAGPAGGAARLVGRRERRRSGEHQTISPERLIHRHLEDARRQLVEGREALKEARRRVVQLEDAVANWERLADQLRAGRTRGAQSS